MVLSELQALSTPDKLKYLRSPDGIALLTELLSSLPITKVATMLQIPNNTFYRFRIRNPEIAVITKKPVATKIDLSRPPAYRIMAGYSYHYHTRGEILSEYTTAEELWHSSFIHSYFSSFGKGENDYFNDYLKEIAQNGIFQLSYTFCILYCNISPSGIVKILKSTP